MTSDNFTTTPPFGMNGLYGLQQNAYYWCRNPADGTRFIVKLENNGWWTYGVQWQVNITREQIICKVKEPEN